MRCVSVVAFVLLTTACSSPEASVIEQVKKAVANELRDPASAQFRNLVTVNHLVCGEVNGKNGFGGYAGFQPFIAYHDPEQSGVILGGEEPKASGMFHGQEASMSGYLEMCAKDGAKID